MKTATKTPAGYYVEITTQNKTGGERVTYYGPFATIDAARRGRFFHWDQKTFYKYQTTSPRFLFACGQYDEGEIDGVLADPKAFGYTSMKVRPASELPVDAFWATTGVAADYPEGNLDGHATFADFFFHDMFRREFNREPVL